ncbi:MORN repeat-containing protein 3 isoform X1 [Drosophila grimshawi]|uniref:MORN repeat-containing protein 3 n=1 Tax=Drosophila grimshawi TaxID=7222 RepID=B4JVI7_DROGR|nr:MORN repeat-containing protein 3 isoform X1 [Drosophila grimshawi]EDV98455.1 GH22662 [Drosophila grimshawi]
MGICVRRFLCPNKPVCSTGCRATFYYPGGGSYTGYWLCNKHHGWGTKTTAERSAAYYANKKQPQGQLIYNGHWAQGKRQGCGSMIRKRGTDMQTVYTGQWYDDMKCGEGKQFYPDGCVYFGCWLRNRRHGLGIQWYGDGSIYVGEWEADFKHGLGIHFYANGNRYEGHFSRGYKNGEGVFYHMHTGQIQKGMWENDNAKTSLMQDERDIRRNDEPTPYPIPRNYLTYPNEIMRELFQRYRPRADLPHRRFNDKVSLEFVHSSRQFASFEERLSTPTALDLHPNSGYVCTCSCSAEIPAVL